MKHQRTIELAIAYGVVFTLLLGWNIILASITGMHIFNLDTEYYPRVSQAIVLTNVVMAVLGTILGLVSATLYRLHVERPIPTDYSEGKCDCKEHETCRVCTP